MKNVVIFGFIILLLSAQTAFASVKNCAYENENCSLLIENIRSQKDTLYNVLNLSEEQRKIKDEIEKRRVAEMQPLINEYRAEKCKLQEMVQLGCSDKEYKQQRKITNNAHKKIHKAFKKYDREFMKILCSLQKSKYREINRMVKKDLRYCRSNRRICPKNPYVNTFGKQDAKSVCSKKCKSCTTNK